jgi:glycogen(starch) synthase
VHSPAPTDTAGGLLRRLAADADRIVAVSGAHGRELASALPQATPKLSVIPNSIPFPAIAPTPLPLDKPLVLCVGRLAEEKGFDLALRALAILNKGGISLDLAIAGNGPVKGDLERLALDLGIAHLVHFTDWILPPDMPDMLNLSTILLMPSRWAEPFGLVALQAAQMARPVIATNRGGLPEIVIHDETGLLVPPDDALALVDATRKLLDYPENTVTMAQNARKRATEGFDFGHMVDAYEAAFDRVIVKARSSAPGGSV